MINLLQYARASGFAQSNFYNFTDLSRDAVHRTADDDILDDLPHLARSKSTLSQLVREQLTVSWEVLDFLEDTIIHHLNDIPIVALRQRVVSTLDYPLEKRQFHEEPSYTVPKSIELAASQVSVLDVYDTPDSFATLRQIEHSKAMLSCTETFDLTDATDMLMEDIQAKPDIATLSVLQPRAEHVKTSYMDLPILPRSETFSSLRLLDEAAFSELSLCSVTDVTFEEEKVLVSDDFELSGEYNEFLLNDYQPVTCVSLRPVIQLVVEMPLTPRRVYKEDCSSPIGLEAQIDDSLLLACTSPIANDLHQIFGSPSKASCTSMSAPEHLVLYDNKMRINEPCVPMLSSTPDFTGFPNSILGLVAEASTQLDDLVVQAVPFRHLDATIIWNPFRKVPAPINYMEVPAAADCVEDYIAAERSLPFGNVITREISTPMPAALTSPLSRAVQTPLRSASSSPIWSEGTNHLVETPTTPVAHGRSKHRQSAFFDRQHYSPQKLPQPLKAPITDSPIVQPSSGTSTETHPDSVACISANMGTRLCHTNDAGPGRPDSTLIETDVSADPFASRSYHKRSLDDNKIEDDSCKAICLDLGSKIGTYMRLRGRDAPDVPIATRKISDTGAPIPKQVARRILAPIESSPPIVASWWIISTSLLQKGSLSRLLRTKSAMVHFIERDLSQMVEADLIVSPTTGIILFRSEHVLCPTSEEYSPAQVRILTLSQKYTSLVILIIFRETISEDEQVRIAGFTGWLIQVSEHLPRMILVGSDQEASQYLLHWARSEKAQSFPLEMEETMAELIFRECPFLNVMSAQLLAQKSSLYDFLMAGANGQAQLLQQLGLGNSCIASTVQFFGTRWRWPESQPNDASN